MISTVDGIRHSNYVRVDKYDPDTTLWVAQRIGHTPKGFHFQDLGVIPDEVVEDFTPNLLTTGGLGRLTSFLIGTGSLVGFSGTTTTAIGVGNVATAAAAADTQLGANSASNSRYQPVDSTPTRTTVTVTNDTIQCVVTFASADANFAWAEWGAVLVTTAAASDTFAATGTSPLLFNHKIASLGTKVSGASWTFTAKLTFS